MSALDDLETIRDAVSSVDTCTVRVVSTLQVILGCTTRSKKDDTTSARRKKHTTDPPARLAKSTKERHDIATLVVNACLRLLSEQARNIASTPNQNAQTTTPPAAKSKSARPLREIANPPATKNSVNTELLSAKPPSPPPSPPGLASAAECSLLAFQYLSQSTSTNPQRTSKLALQLETGMLAMSSKMITLGLDKQSVRLLALTKKSFEQSYGASRDQPAAKETLSTLFNLQPKTVTLDVLYLIQTYFSLLLRVMARPDHTSSISPALVHLDPSNPHSPCAVTLDIVQLGGDKSRACKQLEAYAQQLAILSRPAPSRPPLSPSTIIQLRTLVLRVRRLASSLAGQRIDAVKDVLRPLSDALTNFDRSIDSRSKENYDLALRVYNSVVTDNDLDLDAATVSPELRIIHTVMLDLAISGTDKSHWAHKLGASNTSSGSALALANLKFLTLRVERGDDQCQDMLPDIDIDEYPDPADLLSAIDALRKACTKRLSERSKHAKDPSKSQKRMLCFFIFQCASIVSRYYSGSSVKVAVQQPLAVSNSLVVSFYHTAEAAIYATRIWMTEIDGPLDILDSALCTCNHLILSLSSIDQEQKALHLSNLFWLAYQKHYNSNMTSAIDLASYLPRSIELLRSRPTPVRRAGFYAVKLERLAQVEMKAGHPQKSYDALSSAIDYHIALGTTSDIHLAAQTRPLRQALSFTDEAQSLQRLLHLQAEVADMGRLQVPFHDATSRPANDRAILLESQLSISIELCSKSTYARYSSTILTRLGKTIEALLNLYNAQDQPLRYLALHRTVMLLELRSPGSMRSHITHFPPKPPRLSISDPDTTFFGMAMRLLESISILSDLRAPILDITKLDLQLSRWLELCEEDWPSYCLQIDDLNVFRMMMVNVALHLSCHRQHRTQHKALRILLSLCKSQFANDICSQLWVLTELGASAMNMNMSSTAEVYLDQGLAIIEDQQHYIDTFARMRLYLKRFSLFIALDQLDDAQAAFSSYRAAAAFETSKNSDRTAFYASQAEVGLLYSRLAIKSGYLATALTFARESLRLYKSLLAALDRQDLEQQAQRAPMGVDALSNGIVDLNLSGTVEVATEQPESWTPGVRLLQLQMFGVLCYIASLYLDQGLKSEVEHYHSRAESLSSPWKLDVCQRMVQKLKLQLMSLAGDSAKLSDASLKTNMNVPNQHVTLSHVRYTIARGNLLARCGNSKEALDAFDGARTMMLSISEMDRSLAQRPVHIKPTSDVAQVNPKSRRSPSAKVKVLSTSRSKRSNKTKVKASVQATREGSDDLDGDNVLISLHAHICCQKALTHLAEGKVEAAAVALTSVDDLTIRNADGQAFAQLTKARINLASINERLNSDVKYNMIPEATISLPALASVASHNERPITEPAKKCGRSKKVTQPDNDLVSLLHETTRLISASLPKSLAQSAMDLSHQRGALAATAEMLQSAVSQSPHHISQCHPIEIALDLQLSPIDAIQRQLIVEATDKSRTQLQELLLGAALQPSPDCVGLSTTDFHRDYIKILPKAWTVVSLGLNEKLDELWMTRLERDETPFTLRLPLKRQSGSEVDDEVHLDFETGRSELREIIECSNFSCHNSVDTTVKGAKTKWWTEREALDHRLHELLVNIENIWLGGFKGLFSLHQRRPDLVARFRKSFDNILDRHLPSRSGTKIRATRLCLDNNILELFIGLSHVSEDAADLGEQVLDLLHFVLDTLQFNGEANAFDEVDIDGMAVDTLDAMRSHSEAADSAMTSTKRHLILVLDKSLHAFPWESLACLQGQSVSRVGSMLHIRERVLAMRRQTPLSERHLVPRTQGTYILNPSGDLTKTQDLLEPYLAPLQTTSGWTSMTKETPSSAAFIDRLSSSNLLLYFGHGSGNQYISNRSIRRLDKSPQVVWLMGCSSGTVTEHGELEPVSVPLSYLVAGESNPVAAPTRARPSTRDGFTDERVDSGTESGALTADSQSNTGREGICMAVLATLWDVTDRDIDRFSIRVGQEWGLFPNATKTPERLVPKTPRRAVTMPKSPRATTKTAARTGGRDADRKAVDDLCELAAAVPDDVDTCLSAAVARGRDACYLRYLNGAAAVVYGVPVYLGD